MKIKIEARTILHNELVWQEWEGHIYPGDSLIIFDAGGDVVRIKTEEEPAPCPALDEGGCPIAKFQPHEFFWTYLP